MTDDAKKVLGVLLMFAAVLGLAFLFPSQKQKNNGGEEKNDDKKKGLGNSRTEEDAEGDGQTIKSNGDEARGKSKGGSKNGKVVIKRLRQTISIDEAAAATDATDDTDGATDDTDGATDDTDGATDATDGATDATDGAV